MKKGYKSIITFSSLLLASITVDAIPFVNNKSLFINAKATSNYSFVLGASNIASTSLIKILIMIMKPKKILIIR